MSTPATRKKKPHQIPAPVEAVLPNVFPLNVTFSVDLAKDAISRAKIMRLKRIIVTAMIDERRNGHLRFHSSSAGDIRRP